ncbi:MAG TPA: orotate phosphoribosyltransferase [Polyangiaceae bacterium]|nr:orotate phosphoribosyltransferase [Polyangiaceae bacterium]
MNSQDTLNVRAALLDELVRHAYQYSPEKPFLLVSGQYSDEYLDCKLALSQPAAMASLGRVFLASIKVPAVAIGGLTMGSDPIAMSTSQASYGSATPLRWFTVRKEAKGHGQKKLVEGSVKPGESVVVVDDVCTTGGSTVKAIEAARDFGLQVAQVIVLVDREQSDGIANIQRAAGDGVGVSAVFTKSQVKARWLELKNR